MFVIFEHFENFDLHSWKGVEEVVSGVEIILAIDLPQRVGLEALALVGAAVQSRLSLRFLDLS